MSYLGPPRLHFSGWFYANTSTVNNYVQNFRNATFRPEYEARHIGGWNPYGTGVWRFSDCTVQSVAYGDGTIVRDPGADPAVGMSLHDSRRRVPAKLVDLDPQQQMVPQIWGFELHLADKDGAPQLGGGFAVTPPADHWERFAASESYDRGASAYFQSVLQDVTWSDTGGSRLLKEIRETGSDPTRLSVRFTVDGFDNRPESPRFNFGRVVGAIGPYHDHEPYRFVAGRILRPPPRSLLNFAQAQVTDSRLVIDLSNSLPTVEAGGDLVDVGALQLVVLTPEGPKELDTVPYLSTRWYEETAGIHGIELDKEQLGLVKSFPLAVIRSGDSEAALAEQGDGLVLRADDFVFRLNPGDTATASLYARKFGEPAKCTVSLTYDNSFLIEQEQVQDWNPGTPKGALTFPDKVKIDKSGTADVTLTASDPKNPRGYIDGQVYGVGYQWKGEEGAVYDDASPSGILNCLVWDEYKVVGRPTWLGNVKEIFTQYANLYPVMKPIVDLSDYMAVREKRHQLELVFSLPLEDPNSMPVVRDLSAAKRAMILRWLKDPLYLKIDSLDGLKWALERAIRLEFATIPPYLCALYSIKPGRNTEVADIIRSVVIEEMLHMALACNLLNAIGGKPSLDAPGFAPSYPTGLPAGLRPGLEVSLKKCSIEHIRDCFLSVEEPEATIDPKGSTDLTHVPIDHPLTIGWFYNEIEAAFEHLDKAGGLFTGPPELQVTEWRSSGELVKVTDLKSAKKAIDEIIEQGEGASPFDPTDGLEEMAHFYKFEEIVRGRRIELTKDGYDYTGPPVPFDVDGVWPMMDNPDTARLVDGSRARLRSAEFNNTYSGLLQALSRVFNGHPEELDRALGIMYSLQLAARTLMQLPSGLNDGTTAGPAFQANTSVAPGAPG